MESAELTRLLGLLGPQGGTKGTYGPGGSELLGLAGALPGLLGGRQTGDPTGPLGGLGGLTQLAPLLQGLSRMPHPTARPRSVPDLGPESGPVIDVEVEAVKDAATAEPIASTKPGPEAQPAAETAAGTEPGPEAQPAAETAASTKPGPEAQPAAETATSGAGEARTHRRAASDRRAKPRSSRPALDPQTLLQVLTGLEQLSSLRSRPDPAAAPPPNSPPNPPPPEESPAEEFDPCQLCARPCLRKPAACLSFEQARQLAAAFPPYL